VSDVVYNVMEQPIHVMQVFHDVILMVRSAMSVVVCEIVNVDGVFEGRVHLAVGLAVTLLVLIMVVHFPADRICFPLQSIGQRVYVTPFAECRPGSIMSVTGLSVTGLSVTGLSESTVALLKTKEANSGNGD